MGLIIDQVLTKTKEKLGNLTEWDVERIGQVIKEVEEDLNQATKVVMQTLRYALAGLDSGVGVPTILEILGPKTSIARLEGCISHNRTGIPV
jgi:glutamyl/glutaminyl-tRNA synthetase